MPVIAVAGAIGAVAVAGSAVAATAGGIAAISAVTAFEIVAAVGATVGAIGAVTKNKTLSMVGLAVGAIGGVGALASSAGLFGAEAASGASLFGSSTPAASNTFAEGLAPATAGSAAGDGAVDSGTWTSSVANAASDGTIPFVAGAQEGTTAINPADVTPPSSDQYTFSTTSENASDPARELAKADNPTINLSPGASPPGTIEPGMTSPSLLPSDVTTPPGAPPAPPNNFGTSDPLTGQNVTTGVTGKITSLADAPSSSIFGKIATFAGDHPVAALGVLQAGSSLLSGATNTLTPAQVAYYNANAANNNAAAALAQRQLATMAQPKAAATLTPVTGSAGPIIPQTQGGFLNNAPRLAAVTGAVG